MQFGENKVQEAIEKWSEIKTNIYLKIELHMLGKLQTNKVKHALKIFDYIHSLDRLNGLIKFQLNKKNFYKNYINYLFKLKEEKNHKSRELR